MRRDLSTRTKNIFSTRVNRWKLMSACHRSVGRLFHSFGRTCSCETPVSIVVCVCIDKYRRRAVPQLQLWAPASVRRRSLPSAGSIPSGSDSDVWHGGERNVLWQISRHCAGTSDSGIGQQTLCGWYFCTNIACFLVFFCSPVFSSATLKSVSNLALFPFSE